MLVTLIVLNPLLERLLRWSSQHWTTLGEYSLSAYLFRCMQVLQVGSFIKSDSAAAMNSFSSSFIARFRFKMRIAANDFGVAFLLYGFLELLETRAKDTVLVAHLDVFDSSDWIVHACPVWAASSRLVRVIKIFTLCHTSSRN